MKKQLIGKSFTSFNGTSFKVISIESYPKAKVSARYEQILNFKAGFLVAVSFRGVLIPNITLEEGVARLTAIEVDGQIVKTAKSISDILGIKQGMTAYSVK